jgi:hypothetical protein
MPHSGEKGYEYPSKPGHVNPKKKEKKKPVGTLKKKMVY